MSLVSVSFSGNALGNGDSLPVDISADGRYVLFESAASNLVTNDTNSVSDVFLRDLLTSTTTLVSVATNGAAANKESRSPAMSSDGRYVAFVSPASNLVPLDTNGIPDIFVRDLQSGTTTMASPGALPLSGSAAGSEAPEITPDGRFVVFYSSATNLAADVPPGGDIYVRDLLNQTTIWASSGARLALQRATGSTNAVCCNHRISEDGQFVAYEVSIKNAPGSTAAGVIARYQVLSATTDLVYSNATVAISAPEDARTLDMTPDGRFIVFTANAPVPNSTNTSLLVWDGDSSSIVPVSIDLFGQTATNGVCDWPTLDPGGRYISFLSSAPNLVANPLFSGFHLFQRDLSSSTTTLIDAATNGAVTPLSADSWPVATDDGLLVAFKGLDSNIVANDRNRADDVFLSNLAGPVIEFISAHDPGLPSSTPSGANLLALTSVSQDGNRITFTSDADNLTANDTNLYRDVFVRDLANCSVTLVSAATNGFSGDFPSLEPAISTDGNFVAFSSMADNLVPGDNNGARDVFIRDLQSGTIRCVSMNKNNTGPGNMASSLPIPSRDGRFVLFRSAATDLANGAFTIENLFLRDLVLQTNYALTTSGAGSQTMTPDGNLVLYSAGLPTSQTLRVWNRTTFSNVFSYGPVSTTTVLPTVGISQDGGCIAYSGSGFFQTVNLATGVRTVLSSTSAQYYSNLRLNSNGTLLVCICRTSALPPQVYLFDLQTFTNKLLSTRSDGTAAANGPSDLVDISADGRFVAYRSSAADILSSDPNGLANIFLCDLLTGATTLLSSTPSGNFGAGSSLTPVFSGDGRTLVFQSLAGDLVSKDFNSGSDIFTFPFLYASIQLVGPGQPPQIFWPTIPGRNYQVQYQNNPGDSSWSVLPGVYTISGNRAYLPDPSPDANLRVYRIVSSDSTP